MVLDLAFDTSTPTGEFALTMLAAVAQLERRQTSERTTAALAAAKARGQRLGRPASDATRSAGLRARELRAAGSTWAATAEVLGAEGYRTAAGYRGWSITQARRAVATVDQDEEAAAKRAEAAT